MNGLFVTLAAFASLSGLYVMQSVWNDNTVTRDAPWVRNSYRFSMIGISLAFLWCAAGVYESDQAPWPPIFAVTIFWDVIMVTRAVSIGVRRSHWDSPGMSVDYWR